MNIITTDLDCQEIDTDKASLLGYESILDRDYLIIPGLEFFKQTGAPQLNADTPREHNVESHKPQQCYVIKGIVSDSLYTHKHEVICQHCGSRLHLNANLFCLVR